MALVFLGFIFPEDAGQIESWLEIIRF